MNNNDSYKGNENDANFVQKDVFKELALAENAVTDIYQFKEDFRVKTIYEKFNGLFKFGDKFKFILSLLTASLASIGLFFFFYFDTFEGFINYVLIGLAVVFGLSVAIGLEYSKYVISPIIAQSWLRDSKIQKGLIMAAIFIMCASVGSTVYGTYKIIELYYVPQLADVEAVGGDQKTQIANYQTKIDKAENEKAAIEKRRAKYEKSSGKNGSWIQHKDYTLLTSNISDFEAQITTLREQIRADKLTTKADNETTKTKHAANKYSFVWVGGIVALLCEIGLLIVLFLLQKYKFATLKQLDTIQSPLQTVLNLVENPLTALKSHLIGGGQNLVVATSSTSNVPPMVTNQMANVNPIATNTAANINPTNVNTGSNITPITANLANNQTQNFTSNTAQNTPYTSNQIGFRIGGNSQPKIAPQKEDKTVSVQTVSTNELSKIELKILHYTKQVRDSENRLGKLKQKAAIEKTKKALSNRQKNLQYWEKKKSKYQGKVIA